MFKCSTCKEEKPLSDFHKHRTHKRQQDCKACQAERSRNLPLTVKAKRLSRTRNKHLIRKYGITSLDYENLLTGQGGVCWICKRPPKTKRLSVDHCHKTGKVRGLLCYICNCKLLPLVKENPEILRRAAAYLTKN